jgi:hypothetical protein
MDLDVSTSTRIERPADEVAAYAFDPLNDPAWIGGIFKVEPLTSGPTGLGSRVRRLARFAGRTVDYEMEVVELEPARRIRLHAIRSPFPMDVTYAFEPTPDGRTAATIRVRGAVYGLMRLLGPLVPAMVRRSITKDIAELKRVMEAS